MKADILIVDDLPDNLHLLSSMLMENGYQVRNAINAKRAFKAIERQIPDVILLDIRLPDGDGYEVCRRLQASAATGQIPVIFISALDDVLDKVKAFEVGGVDYITKPFQVFEVMARVGSQLKISRLQRQLRQQNEQLSQEIREREKAESGLKLLLHAVSHDLRTPMMGMSLAFQSFLREAQADVVIDKVTLERMLRSCERKIKLINSLIETSEAQVWGLCLERKLISLEDLIADLLADWHLILQENKVELNHNISPDLPLVEVDSDKLWRVFENLISNAIKYNSPGLSLSLTVSREGDLVRCQVADNGVGIAAEQCESLFDIYSRGTQIKGKVGLGLGLYLCRQIINAHGGEIGVESALGNGTTFWFTLPVK